MLSSGQDFGKNFLDSKHVLKLYFKPSRKNPYFLFLSLPSEPLWLKICHLIKTTIVSQLGLRKVRSHKESKVPCQGHKCSDLYCTLYDFIRTSKNIHQMSPSRMFSIRVRKNLSVEAKRHLRQKFYM